MTPLIDALFSALLGSLIAGVVFTAVLAVDGWGKWKR